MPIYAYQCKECGEAFEIRSTIKEKESGLQLLCPRCGSREARQVLTAALMLHNRGAFSPPVCSPNAGPGYCG